MTLIICHNRTNTITVNMVKKLNKVTFHAMCAFFSYMNSKATPINFKTARPRIMKAT